MTCNQCCPPQSGLPESGIRSLTIGFTSIDFALPISSVVCMMFFASLRSDRFSSPLAAHPETRCEKFLTYLLTRYFYCCARTLVLSELCKLHSLFLILVLHISSQRQEGDSEFLY